jgi:hypothetical protein
MNPVVNNLLYEIMTVACPKAYKKRFNFVELTSSVGIVRGSFQYQEFMCKSSTRTFLPVMIRNGFISALINRIVND